MSHENILFIIVHVHSRVGTAYAVVAEGVYTKFIIDFSGEDVVAEAFGHLSSLCVVDKAVHVDCFE